MIFKLLLVFLSSQILYLGAFALSPVAVYVVNDSENLCWEFTRGNNKNPNWLQSWWKAIENDNNLNLRFLTDINCENTSSETCCKSLWYRYAGIPIGVKNISEERKSAEFLAGKKIIQSQSLSPQDYNLDSYISRKEIMKVIINASDIVVNNSCTEIFQDVENDWGCKYIETAFNNNYISWNEKFRPDSQLTKSEALKLIFKARNIKKVYTTNSWQEDYISTALYLWYIDVKYSDFNESANRWWIFSVLSKTYPEFKNY